MCVTAQFGSGTNNTNEKIPGTFKVKFTGGHYLQRIVDVEMVRNLIWFRRRAGSTSEKMRIKRFRDV